MSDQHPLEWPAPFRTAQEMADWVALTLPRKGSPLYEGPALEFFPASLVPCPYGCPTGLDWTPRGERCPTCGSTAGRLK